MLFRSIHKSQDNTTKGPGDASKDDTYIPVRSDGSEMLAPGNDQDCLIVFKLRELIEALPGNIFLTPTGVIVISNGDTVESNAHSLRIPPNLIKAIQFADHHAINSGRSLPVGLSTNIKAMTSNRIMIERTIKAAFPEDRWNLYERVSAFALEAMFMTLTGSPMADDRADEVMLNVYERVREGVDQEFFTPVKRHPRTRVKAPKLSFIDTATLDSAHDRIHNVLSGGKPATETGKGRAPNVSGKGAAPAAPRVVPPPSAIHGNLNHPMQKYTDGRWTPPHMRDDAHDWEFGENRVPPADRNVYAEFVPTFKYNDHELCQDEYRPPFQSR